MISYIEGEIIRRGSGFVILKSGGVGFKIFIMPTAELSGERAAFFTHLAVREDALTLYGFLDYEELELFEILIGVSGVGPKAGLGILTIANPATIKMAIGREDVSILTRVSGIGKRTAERVILELKNKFTLADVRQGALTSTEQEILEQQDAIEALMGLGYDQTQARKALEKIPRDLGLEERIKLALKELGKKK
jgi:Holliday junction DNA helicase RuvA